MFHSILLISFFCLLGTELKVLWLLSIHSTELHFQPFIISFILLHYKLLNLNLAANV